MSHSKLALYSILPSHDTDSVFLSSEHFACWLTFINDLMKNSCEVPRGFGLNGVTLIYCQLVSTLAPLPFTTCRSVHYCHHNKRLLTIYPSVCLARSVEACFLSSLLWEHYLRWTNVSETINEISTIELIEGCFVCFFNSWQVANSGLRQMIVLTADVDLKRGG